MKVSDDLFLLIKSLTQAEKSFFKVYARGKKNHDGETKYVLLFNAINKQKEYNEQAILIQFKREPFVKQFHVKKHYLFRFILKSLAAFHLDIEKSANELLHHARILFQKSMFKQCYKILNKTKQICYQNEKFALLLEGLRIERNLKLRSNLKGVRSLEAIYKESSLTIEKIRNINEYLMILDDLNNELRNFGQIEVNKRFESLIRNPMLQKESSALSFRAKVWFNRILAVYYFAKKNYKKSYLNLSKNLDLFKNYPSLFKENPAIILNTHIQLINACLELKNYKEAYNRLEDMRNFGQIIPSKGVETIQVLFDNSYYEIKLILCRETAEYKKGIELQPSITKLIQYNKPEVPLEYQMEIYYSLAWNYFGNNEYKNALLWIDKILNKNKDVREDIHSWARIISLIIYYELGNVEMMEAMVKSSRRYFEGAKLFHKVEKAILTFFWRKILISNSEKGKIIDFKEIKAEINTLFRVEKTSNDFDIISWIESKIEKKSFGEIVRSKTKYDY